MPSLKLVQQNGRSSDIASLLLTVFVCCLATGCGQTKYADSHAAGYVDYAAPQLDPPLPSPVQARGIELVKQYVAAVNSKDYTAANKMLSPTLQAQWTPAQIAWQMTKGGYWMLAGSTDWQYNQVQGHKHGTEMIVHTSFNATDHNLYKTNFTFVNKDGNWMIDTVMNPVQKTKPKIVPLDQNAPGGKSGK